MSTKLSFHAFSSLLAALGAVACGGPSEPAQSPVNATEVPAETPGATPAPESGPAAPEPATPAATDAPGPTSAAEPAPATSDAAAPKATEAPSASPTKKVGKKKAAGGHAACGAGTCG